MQHCITLFISLSVGNEHEYGKYEVIRCCHLQRRHGFPERDSRMLVTETTAGFLSMAD